jgi:methionyl-tRNA formyltransferase
MYILVMKIYFFGTPEFAVPVLKTLATNDAIEIQGVVTQPDKPGNRKVITPPPVKVAAAEMGLEVFQPEKIDKQLIDQIREDSPDAIIVVAYGGLIPKELIEIPEHGCLNIHPSLLPKYRGASPIQETLLNGDKETGISIIQLDEELDHGPILLIKRMSVDPSDNFTTLSKNLSEASAILMILALEDMEQGTLTPIPQEHSKATFCRKIEKKEGEINWNRPAEEILNQIRALNPWPSTYTNLNNKTLKILEAKILDNTSSKKPGEIELIDKETFAFKTKDKLISPTKVQLEGKPATTSKEFINGNRKLLEN